MSNRGRLALVGLAVVVAVVAFVVIGSSSKTDKQDKQSTTGAASGARPVALVVRHGKPVGGVRKISVTKGGRVRFTVDSDTADEIHVHGYDRHQDVAPGKPIRFDFPASIDGIFVVELEKHATQIASLEVQP